MIKRFFYLLSLVVFSFSVGAQGIRTLAISRSTPAPAHNNAYVQAVLDRATTLGYTHPNQTTITALNTLFDNLAPYMSKAEMIKISALKDLDCIDISKLNYVDPTLYESTFVGGTPLYTLKGFSSDGVSYINDHITYKRRVNIHTDASSMVWTDAFGGSADAAACGAVSGANSLYIIRPYYTGASSYYYSNGHVGVIGSGAQAGMTSASTNGSSGTLARFSHDGTFKNGSGTLTAGTNDIDIYTLCYNNAGTPIKYYTVGNVGFRWEGYELTDAEVEGVRTAFATYMNTLFPAYTPGTDITATGRELFLVFGDSKTGTSPSVGVRNSPNTVLQYNRTASAIQEVLASDLANVPSVGSMWPKFGKIWYEETNGKTPVFSLYGLGGSSFYNTAFVNSSWDNLTGTTYASAKTAHDAALSAVGVTKPKGIFVILGINDGNRTETQATMLNQITSLIDRINTDYAGGTVPIYLSLFSKPNAATAQQTGRQTAMKLRMFDLMNTYSNLYITCNEGAIFGNGLQDNTHFDYAGNELFATWSKAFIDNTETDRDVRRILTSTFPTTLTTSQKAAFKTFIEDSKTHGNWGKFASLDIQVASGKNNTIVDLIGFATMFDHSSTWTADNDVSYNGSSSYLETGFEQTLTAGNSSLNDVIIGVRTSNADTPQNTQATLFGQYNGTNYTLVRQNTSAGLEWGVNVASGNISTYTGGAGKIPAGADVAIRRSAASGTNASQLLIDGTVVQSSTAASNSISSKPFYLGCLNNNGTAAQFWQGGTKYFFVAQNSGFDYAAAIADLNNLLGAIEGDYFSNVSTSQSGNIISTAFTTLVTNQNQPPTIETVTVSGTPEKDQILTCNISGFNSPGGYPEGSPTIKWYRSTSKQSVGTEIVGSTSVNYTATATDVGKYCGCGASAVQVGGMNTTGTEVRSTYTDQIQDTEFNPITDIPWFIALTKESASTLTGLTPYWDNLSSTGGDATKNGTDNTPTYVAGQGVDFEASNNEELILDQPNPQMTMPITIIVRAKFESFPGSWSFPLAWSSSQNFQTRTGGAIYLSGGDCAYTATTNKWTIFYMVVSGASNTSKFKVNNGSWKTNVAASTAAFGTSNGRIGSNSAGTSNRADVLISDIYVIQGELTSQQFTDMENWFAENEPYDP